MILCYTSCIWICHQNISSNTRNQCNCQRCPTFATLCGTAFMRYIPKKKRFVDGCTVRHCLASFSSHVRETRLHAIGAMAITKRHDHGCIMWSLYNEPITAETADPYAKLSAPGRKRANSTLLVSSLCPEFVTFQRYTYAMGKLKIACCLGFVQKKLLYKSYIVISNASVS